VDPAGKVVAMIFAKSVVDSHIQYAVPARLIQRDLRRARQSSEAVDTGGCDTG